MAKKDVDTLEFDFKAAPVERHVLPWSRPLPRAAAEWLARAWDRSGPLDLSDHWVLVPTRQSGRRLREALAAYAAEAQQAVFPPRVILPETLATPDESTHSLPLATRAEQQLAWIRVLLAIDLSEFAAVFPRPPAVRSFTWARELAGQFLRLQRTLGEGGLSIVQVPEKMRSISAPFPEAERWAQLARLASRVERQLKNKERSDPFGNANGREPASLLPPEVRRVVLLAAPDPAPLALQILAARGPDVAVEVVIYGPNEENVDPLFDEWGRPRTEAWSQRSLEWPQFEQRVHLCANAEEQANRVVALAARYPSPSVTLGVGVADAEVLPSLQRALARAEIPAYNPAGRPWRQEVLHPLLAALADFSRSTHWDAVSAIARCVDVLVWLQREVLGETSGAQFLRELDQLAEAHLPPTLAVGRRHAAAQPQKYPAASKGLEALTELRERLTEGVFPANAVGTLQHLFAHRRLESGSLLFEAIEAWTETVGEAGRALALFGEAELSLGEAWEFTLALYGERVRFEDKAEGAVELQGWLELLWEDAPHLVVAGLNDGKVPESIVGDAFLPEGLRESIGLKTNAARFARDAYLLQALAGSRSGEAGRLDILVGKVSESGDPLRPSRLLLRCPDERLPGRVAWLFREVEAEQSSLPWTRTWTLKPAVVAPPIRVSVTGLRDWLRCPFRFYLRHALRMRRVEPEKAELDARDFGTLIHAAVQQMASPDLRDLVDPVVLRDHVLKGFEQAVRATYGDLLTLPLLIQFESARQRLRKLAEVEAREREAGWRTDRVEWPFELSLFGLTVRGTIDRVDRNLHDPSRIRVVDYKTSDTGVTPAAAHLRPLRADDAALAPWRRVRIGGKERVWSDLQLPLYRRALSVDWGDAVECGYFNLPKATGETALISWPELDRDLQGAAERCAEGVARSILAGNFWPPAEITSDDDDWREFFHQGAEASIAAEVAAQLRGKAENL